ncbi:MAG TPA: APC family permease [Spirochaetia bacterium]|nr:APC family permease [Spirochaetia bacterium]
MSDSESGDLFSRLKEIVLGKAKDVRDPSIFHKLSLIAFFAWVGLGADGLSSANYGPEESFLSLGANGHLGIFVALATAITVIVIASSYSQIVELFPGGGGGYLVASKLLSPTLGMISGCALLIDYVLTITLSIASGADAIFSFLPIGWLRYKLIVAILGVLLLMVMNLRGVRESVMPLVPLFLVFLITHTFAILYAVLTHLPSMGDVAQTTATQARSAQQALGGFGVFLLLMRAYSMGAGTYTGLEAVSNGLPILREPRVQTAKRTMRYMAASLAFMAAGLMIGYLLFGVTKAPGKTLNAVLMERIAGGWGAGGTAFVLVTLVSEAVLLFVAAQAGFLDGPRVLANMSLDRWLPGQFSLLSERLVIKNGIVLMGGAALILMLVSRGSVNFLIVLYAINVFITFCLSQAGMVRHWWKERTTVRTWKRKFLINGIGLLLTGFILVSQIVLKFETGGWITILVTGSLVLVAVFVRRFYHQTGRRLARLDHLMAAAAESDVQALAVESRGTRRKPAPKLDPRGKIAVLLVSGFNGTGLHTLFNIRRVFGDTFRNWFFIQAGIIDADRFKGAEGIEKLRQHVEEGLAKYVTFMQAEGYYAQGFAAVGTDISDEICDCAKRIFRKHPNTVFFGGQIVFSEESLLTRLLFNHTAFAVQRRLHREGIPFLIMPVRVGAPLRLSRQTPRQYIQSQREPARASLRESPSTGDRKA